MLLPRQKHLAPCVGGRIHQRRRNSVGAERLLAREEQRARIQRKGVLVLQPGLVVYERNRSVLASTWPTDEGADCGRWSQLGRIEDDNQPITLLAHYLRLPCV